MERVVALDDDATDVAPIDVVNSAVALRTSAVSSCC